MALVVALARGAHAKAAVDAPPAESSSIVGPPSSKRSPLPVIAGVAALGSAAAAVPIVRRSASGLVRKLLDRDELAGMRPPDGASSRAAAAERGAVPGASSEAAASQAPARRTGSQSAAAGADLEGEQFTLTPERLSKISELNSRLEEIVPLLASVPVFTAASGNGTSPLTVPSEDGKKLAYFFVEHADAEAFLRAVRENAGMPQLDAQVIGVSLADIIVAYSSPDARAAQETFVLIPTMSEVAAARHIIKRSGKEVPAYDPAEPAKLGPANGLVPLFWCEALAVQTASKSDAAGKQRKVLFFRLGDLQQMWKGLADARKEQGELEEMPDGPTVQVSDLQTMASLLVAANKTEDVIFLPSSNALQRAQGQTGRARSGGGGPPGAASAADAADAADGADGAAPDVGMPETGVDDFEGEEEDATGDL